MEQELLHSLFFSLSLYVGFSLAELIGFIYPEMMLPLLIFMYFDSLFPSVWATPTFLKMHSQASIQRIGIANFLFPSFHFSSLSLRR